MFTKSTIFYIALIFLAKDVYAAGSAGAGITELGCSDKNGGWVRVAEAPAGGTLFRAIKNPGQPVVLGARRGGDLATAVAAGGAASGVGATPGALAGLVLPVPLAKRGGDLAPAGAAGAAASGAGVTPGALAGLVLPVLPARRGDLTTAVAAGGAASGAGAAPGALTGLVLPVLPARRGASETEVAPDTKGGLSARVVTSSYTLRPYREFNSAVEELMAEGKLRADSSDHSTWIHSELLQGKRTGFIRKSLEVYKAFCKAAGKPTRLIVGCGHAGSPDGDGSCKGHGEDYYTVNITNGRSPDLLGDAFVLMKYLFQPGFWDFICFECFPWYDNFNASILSIIAKSLTLRGQFVEINKASEMPKKITIGPRGEEYNVYFNAAQAYEELKKLTPARTILHQASDLAGVSIETPDVRTFESHDHLQNVVSSYFKNLGFGGGSMISPPTNVHYELPELFSYLLSNGCFMLRDERTGKYIDGKHLSLVHVKDLSDPSTGKKVTYKLDNLVTTGNRELDHLMGKEFLLRLNLGDEEGQGTFLFVGTRGRSLC